MNASIAPTVKLSVSGWLLIFRMSGKGLAREGNLALLSGEGGM